MTSLFRPAPYALTWQTSLAFFVLFGLVAAAGLGAYQADFQFEAVTRLVPDFYSHSSNLLLSCFLVLAYSLQRVLYGGSMRSIIVLGLLTVALNYGHELLLPLWNTKDPVDAHYGAAGAAVAVAFVYGVRHLGLRPNPAHHKAIEAEKIRVSPDGGDAVEQEGWTA